MGKSQRLKLDAAALPGELRLPFLEKLIFSDFLDEETETLEKMEWDEGFAWIWERLLRNAAQNDMGKLVDRLIGVRRYQALVEERGLLSGIRLYLARNNPEDVMGMR